MTTQEASKEGAPAAGPSLTAIFLTFLRLGGTSFGGGTAGWLHRVIVLQRRWIDEAAFLRMLTVGQALPGSNGTKLTVLIGQHLRGTAGAAVALFALLAGPFLIAVTIRGGPRPVACLRPSGADRGVTSRSARKFMLP